MNSDTRMPYSSEEKRSRPWLSVPSRYSGLPLSIQIGGVSASMRLMVARSKGLCGATQPAPSDPMSSSKSVMLATTATGELRQA